jgi:hypothetical protein
MTTYSRKQFVTTTVEYGVAAGCNIGTFETVKGIAFTDYCEKNGLSRESSIAYSDGWALVEPRDEETVISFVVRKEVSDGR